MTFPNPHPTLPDGAKPPLFPTMPVVGRDLRWSIAILVGLVGVADLLVWGRTAGLGWVALAMLVAAAAQGSAVRASVLRPMTARDRAVAWTLLGLSLLPLIEAVQGLSVLFAVMGLSLFAGCLTAPEKSGIRQILYAGRRFAFDAPIRTLGDLTAVPKNLGKPDQMRRCALQFLRDWALPVGLGSVFVGLFAVANPVLARWIAALAEQENGLRPDWVRIGGWGLFAAAIWPFLRLVQVAPVGPAPVCFGRESPTLPVGLVNPRSVVRALVIFNLLFAVQTALDGSYLWAGVALPDGMTHAGYAHRGAYPLLLTALLAGGFALIAQPFRRDRPVVAGLLLFWIAQTVLLVASSILRLDLYVDSYGLTRLRFAAFVWMGLVAWGLCLMVVQIMTRRSVGWLAGTSAASGLAVLYVACFVNVAGVVAEYNLTRPGLAQDVGYLCGLGAGAAPAIDAQELRTGRMICPAGARPWVMPPRDLREWGYRNWRLRHSLADSRAQAFAGPVTEGRP